MYFTVDRNLHCSSAICGKNHIGAGRDAEFKIGWGALPPDFPIIEGGQLCPPKSQTLGGGKILKIPTYLVLKGQKNFLALSKPRFLDASRRVSGKSFCKSKN